MILYLHGFRSSPSSFKARLLAQHFAELGRAAEFVCPQLPASPAEAIDLTQHLIDQFRKQNPKGNLVLIGSSLGGYYATYLAEKNACKAILVNPAVKPPRDLEKYVGVSTAYHSDVPFEFKHAYIAELKRFVVHEITESTRYFLIAATGDEVLDWREMVAHYPAAKHLVIQGSDHGVSEFADYIPTVIAFCDAE